MALSEEEAQEIKNHLLKQLDNFPEDKREQIKAHLEAMNSKELEEFVQKNKLSHLGGNCIFCSIISGKSNSIKIAEGPTDIAILEINPLSKGHTLIVPKDHEEGINIQSKTLAEDVSQRILERLNPKKVEQNKIEIMGHEVLEVIPLYGNEEGRHQTTEENLLKIKEELTKEIEQKVVQEEKPLPKKEIPKFPARIPY